MIFTIKSKEYQLLTLPRDNLFNEKETIRFGTYPQGKTEDDRLPIEWIILSNDGSKLKLMSKHVLDWKPFFVKAKDKNKYIQPWIYSSLKQWLNEVFINNAFSDEEQEFLVSEDSGIYDDTYREFCPDYAVPDAETKHGHQKDCVRIMCPSYSECPGIGTYIDRKHGTPYGYRRRWSPEEDRPGTGDSLAMPTQYAISQGAPSDQHCKYWLRSFGKFWGTEAIANKDGWLDAEKFGASAGVRPVITIDLTSDVLSYIRKHYR